MMLIHLKFLQQSVYSTLLNQLTAWLKTQVGSVTDFNHNTRSNASFTTVQLYTTGAVGKLQGVGMREGFNPLALFNACHYAMLVRAVLPLRIKPQFQPFKFALFMAIVSHQVFSD